MQDIDKEIERERERVSNRKHKGFVSRFEHTCSTSPPSTHEDFHYARSQWISPQCRNTYKPSDSLVPYTRKPHKLAEAAPQTRSSHPNSKHRGHTRPPPQETKNKSLVITTL